MYFNLSFTHCQKKKKKLARQRKRKKENRSQNVQVKSSHSKFVSYIFSQTLLSSLCFNIFQIASLMNSFQPPSIMQLFDPSAQLASISSSDHADYDSTKPARTRFLSMRCRQREIERECHIMLIKAEKNQT